MKNYLRDFKYVFSILGILFLALIISSSSLVTGTKNRINYMTNEIKTITNDTDLTFERIRNALIDEGKEISPEEAVTDIKNGKAGEKVRETFGEALAGTVSNYANYAGEILRVIGTTVAGLLIIVIRFVILLAVGILLSHDIPFFFARYEINDRNFFRVLLELVLRNLMVLASFLIVALAAWKLPPVVGIILLALYPLLYCFLSMLATWITAGKNRPAFKQFVSFKNVLILFGVDLIEILITALIAGLVVLVSNWFIGIIVGLALLILAALCVTLNSTAYMFEELGVQD